MPLNVVKRVSRFSLGVKCICISTHAQTDTHMCRTKNIGAKKKCFLSRTGKYAWFRGKHFSRHRTITMHVLRRYLGPSEAVGRSNECYRNTPRFGARRFPKLSAFRILYFVFFPLQGTPTLDDLACASVVVLQLRQTEVLRELCI